MIIENLLIKDGLYEKNFVFSDHNNLVYSVSNSRGKTTLLRFLLYALGYSVPSTKGLRFINCLTEVTVKTDSGIVVTVARPASDHVEVAFDDERRTICLPDQKNQLDELLFGISNDLVLNNLLGSFYLDQEKGWTLLNRGTVIGSIHFNIEELIQGLSDRDCSELKEQEMRLNRELSRYQLIYNIKNYRKSLDQEMGSLLNERFDNEVNMRVAQKQLELNDVKIELNRIDRVLRDNKQVKLLVKDLKLRVDVPGREPLLVTPDNIIGLNDSIDFLIAKRKIKASEYRSISSELTRLIQRKRDLEESKLVDVESFANVFDSAILQLPLTQIHIDSSIEKIKEEIRQVRAKISDATRKHNGIVNSLYKNVVKYASEFEIENNASIAETYLFTSNLKELSGALLHKTVFSFRLAYIQEIKNKYGIKLPIILDSPSGKELDRNNVEKMMEILSRDFSDHQLIIASINKYTLPELNVIELKSSLMEDAQLCEQN